MKIIHIRKLPSPGGYSIYLQKLTVHINITLAEFLLVTLHLQKLGSSFIVFRRLRMLYLNDIRQSYKRL